MTEKVFDFIRADLRRPHPFAAERVGFAFAGSSLSVGQEPLLCVSEYIPVPDEGYNEAYDCGAEINSRAIRSAMERSLVNGTSILHIHAHWGPFPLGFSWIDERELQGMVADFKHIRPALPHGAVLMGDTNCIGRIWPPGKTRADERTKIVVIGAQMRFLGEPNATR